MRSRMMLLVIAVWLVGAAYSQEPKSAPKTKNAAPPYERLLKGDDAQKANQLQQQIDRLSEADDYAGAMKSAEALLALRESAQGADHFEAVTARHDLSALRKIAALDPAKRRSWLAGVRSWKESKQLEAQAKYAEALAIRQKHLAQVLEVLGEEHPDTAAIYNNLAANLDALGTTAEAAPLHQKALAINRKVLGEKHPATAAAYNGIASNLDDQGKAAEAEPLYLKALAIRREILGESNAATAVSYNDVAYNLYRQGKYDEAAPLFQKALEIRRSLFGEDSLDTASSYSNVASNLDALGKTGEAMPLNRKVLAIRRKILGEAHPDTATSYNNLAANLTQLGKASEAAPLYRTALDIHRKVFGEDHFYTGASYAGVAANLLAQGKAAEATPLFQKALDIIREILGEEHPDTATMYNNVASSLDEEGKAAAAAPLHRRVLEIRLKVLGKDHPDTAASLNNVASNLEEQGRFTEAAPLYQEALEIIRRVGGEEHPSTAGYYNNVASNLSDLEKHAKAAPLYQRALDIRLKVFGEDHPLTAASYNNLASNLDDQGKAAEAYPLHQKALDIRRRTLGEQHPDTAKSYTNVATNLDRLGKTAEAASFYQKALEINRRFLGVGHPSFAISHAYIGYNQLEQGQRSLAEASLLESVNAYETSRLRLAAGLDRGVLSAVNPRLLLACIQADSAPKDAWMQLESSLARGLLDEQSKGQSSLTPAEESELARLREQRAALEPEILDLGAKPNRSTDEESQLEKLLRERETVEKGLAALSVAASTREVARAEAIQAAIPENAAMLLWLDVTDKTGHMQQHWACVIRREGEPKWERLPGTGEGGKWSSEDSELSVQLIGALRGTTATRNEIESLIAKLRAQRVTPVEKHLADVKTLFVVPVHEMAGIPGELLAPERQIEYVSSGTAIARAAGKQKFSGDDSLLAVGDPVFPPADAVQESPLPPGGILVVNVLPGGAAERDVREGDVLLSYGGVELTDLDTLSKAIAGKSREKSVPVKLWRLTEGGEAITKTVDLAPGRLGANLLQEPAREFLASRRKSELQLAALSRSGRVDLKSEKKQPWKELAGAAVELDRLKKAFGEKATLLTRSAASEQKLEALRKANKLKDFRYLHFATHGMANDHRAFESFLALAQDQLPKYEAKSGEKYFNGELSAREVLDDWKLDADLVVLSACESGLGKAGGGDGFLGFTQAFLLVGARSVCISLWEVDDTATSLLMDRFYQNLLGARDGLEKPLQKAAALREAKNWLKNLTAAEILKLSADIKKSVTRGKDEKLPPVVDAKTVAPQGDLTVKPYADPRIWSAFILIGEPD